MRIATSSTPARYSHCICTDNTYPLIQLKHFQIFCHFYMFPKIKRYYNPEAKNILIRMPLALYQMRIFPQKTSTYLMGVRHQASEVIGPTHLPLKSQNF